MPAYQGTMITGTGAKLESFYETPPSSNPVIRLVPRLPTTIDRACFSFVISMIVYTMSPVRDSSDANAAGTLSRLGHDLRRHGGKHFVQPSIRRAPERFEHVVRQPASADHVDDQKLGADFLCLMGDIIERLIRLLGPIRRNQDTVHDVLPYCQYWPETG